MKKILAAALLAGLMVLATSGIGIAQPVKIGAAINLSGPASTWGQYHAKGQQDYFNYVNEVKGGVAGRKLEMILVDTGYKVPEAVAAVRKFAVHDKVDMIATWGAGEGLAAKPIIQKYKIPTINFSTSWEILEAPIDYMYLPFGSYRMDCYAILDYIKATHTGKEPPRVALLTYNNAYGRSIHKPSRDYAAKIGVNIVAVEEFPPKTVDLTTELLKLKNSKADYVFMQMLPAAIITALKGAERIHYQPAFFGTWTSTDPDFFKLGKGLVKNKLRMQFPGVLPTDNTAGAKLMKDLMKRYKTVSKFDASYWEGVAIGMIMERACLRAQERYGKITRETINAAMESFRGEDFGGVIPKLTYWNQNHEGSFQARIVRVNENGTYAPLTGFFTPGSEKPKILKK
jgi:branched-chain amino acid transport system substrate-binding protein